MKKEKIIFSLIVPVFNTEIYLSKCLNSIVSQTFQNFEVILIDDGSTDGSYEIMLEYKKKYSNIRIIKQKNKGLSAARNIALATAKGEYIWFIDSDDFIREKTALEEIFYYMEKFNLEVLSFNGKFKVSSINEWSKNKNGEKLINKPFSNELKDGIQYMQEIIEKKEWRYAVWLYVYEKNFLLKNNISFTDNIIHEDAAFNILILTKCKRILFCDKLFYTYRIRPFSIMNSKTSINNIKGYMTSFSQINLLLSNYGNKFQFFQKNIFMHLLEKIYLLEKTPNFESLYRCTKKAVLCFSSKEQPSIFLERAWENTNRLFVDNFIDDIQKWSEE